MKPACRIPFSHSRRLGVSRNDFRDAIGSTRFPQALPRRPGAFAVGLPSALSALRAFPDCPCLAAMVSKFRRAPAGFPGAVQLPYPLVDNNTLQAGDNAGFLGSPADPVLVRPDRGRPWGGVSRDLGATVLRRAEGVDAS